MSPYTLNHDVLGLVYDNLTNDRKTLARCSLVCQSWLFPTGAHLFRELSLRKPSLHGDDNRLEALLHIIQVSQRMRHFTRHLELDSKGGMRKYSSFTVAQLEPIVSHLPHLQSIMLCGVHIQIPRGSPLSQPLIARSLRYLEIWNNTECAPLECDALTGFLDLFEHIDELHFRMRLIRNVQHSWDDSEEKRRRVHAPLPVKHVELAFNRSPVFEGIVGALRGSLNLAALEIAQFRNMHPSAVPSVHQLLQRCSALRELRTSLGWEYDSPERNQPPNPDDMQLGLAQCVQLRIFGMSGIVLRLEDGHDLAHAKNKVGWQLLCDTMKTIPTNNSLKVVELGLKLEWRPTIEQILHDEPSTDDFWRYLIRVDWDCLGRELDRFPGLKMVRVRVTVAESELWDEGVWEKVREVFSPRIQRMLDIEGEIKYGL